MNLMEGFIGSIFGAFIGGIVAYYIARLQILQQVKQNRVKEEKEKNEKEVRLLWNIYFDIKRDCENAKLWDRFELFLQRKELIHLTPDADYVHEILTYIARDLCNLFKLLSGKESENGLTYFTELDLLWMRAGHLLIFMQKLNDLAIKYDKYSSPEIINYFDLANTLFQKHRSFLAKRP